MFLGLFFSEYKINPFFFRECMYIVFILQCEKVQNHCQSLVERAETNIILIIFKCVLYHDHPYMNQVPEMLLWKFKYLTDRLYLLTTFPEKKSQWNF